MPIESPNLDDRDFAGLVEEAKQLIRRRCPDWTDLGPSDPGIVLVELFAHLTDVLLYRLNRIPEKAYIEFLRLIGVQLDPPGAASVLLKLTAAKPAERTIEIPRGTRVTVGRPGQAEEAPVFVTAETASIPAGAAEAEVMAFHCELVEAELAGTGTGLPGQSVAARRPPIVAPTGDGLDLVVGVEAAPEELGERVPARRHEGRTYRVWTEVQSFAGTEPDDPVYVVDRLQGVVTFAPAVRETDPATGRPEEVSHPLAAAPMSGREIRLWYRRGGGPLGNVPASSLTLLKDPIPGLEVTNPAAATGGRAPESLENALVRGPQELHSLNRAVTARDFELSATSFGAIARARAFTRAALWTFATPGTVEVVLVPEVPAQQRPQGRAPAAVLRAQQTDQARVQVQALLDERRPLGTSCLVTWGRYKSVSVKARLHVRREEDAPAVRDRVLRALHGTINPLPNEYSSSGWGFGQPLRVSDVYYVAQREPGVRYVDSVRLELEEVPDRAVTDLAADASQPNFWYAASGPLVFTSRDDGAGWQPAGRFSEEEVHVVEPDPRAPGLVAVATRLAPGGSRVHVSADCGETWRQVAETSQFRVEDLTWTVREGHRLVLIATDRGLFELPLEEGAVPVPVLVDPASPSRGLYAVAAGVVRGISFVAVASQGSAGVFLSRDGGRTNSFRSIGLAGEDVRVLAIQFEGPRGFLWAGITVAGAEDPGRGCSSWELGERDPAEKWVAHGQGWAAGSCRGIAFQGSAILAASHHGGVLRLTSRAEDQVWRTPDVNSGLPLRDPGRFLPLDALAVDPQGRLVMTGSAQGVVVSRDGGDSYTEASKRVLTTEDVTVPPTWLLCSGDHEIEVVSE